MTMDELTAAVIAAVRHYLATWEDREFRYRAVRTAHDALSVALAAYDAARAETGDTNG